MGGVKKDRLRLRADSHLVAGVATGRGVDRAMGNAREQSEGS